MVGFAVLFGLLAVFIAQAWLNNQAELRMRSMQTPKKQTPSQTVVVASKALRFGNELNADVLKEVPWPNEAVPVGAFAKVGEVLSGGRRLVLSPIEPNEPVLALKITGPGQRATLSALVGPGMKAVTIRVNDVEGVGGFVLPGDRVDVVLTRQVDKGEASTEVVLQNTRVLAIDQQADERLVKPSVAKAVTLEVDMLDAQKLWLASSIGSLSLLLRKAGDVAEEKTRRITLKDLLGGLVSEEPVGDTRKVVVTRAAKKQEYSVPVEGGAQGPATVGRR
jgi:pilus assembly protein CpaB